jgi:hypothetical protein
LPPFLPPRTRPATPRRAAAAALLAAAGLAVAGCSGSDSSSSSPAAAASSSTKPSEAPAMATKVTIGNVAGVLRRPFRKTFAQHRPILSKQVGAAVDRWLDGGFVGVDYPRPDFPTAFASFTPAAKSQARHQRRLLTNWKWRHDIDGVTTKQRSVALDVLAPHGRPAGVTARVRLVFTTKGDVHKRVTVAGRLFLAPDHRHHWRIFGYDVAKGAK